MQVRVLVAGTAVGHQGAALRITTATQAVFQAWMTKQL